MGQTYDLIVIGSGTAAQTVSHQLAAAGRKVAVIDRRPFGGTCALRGCDPKKVLLGGAQVLDETARMSRLGVLQGDERISWPNLMSFKRSFTAPVPARQAKSYRDSGIDTFHGIARFLTPDTLEVDGSPLQSRHFLIATGARPIPLPFPGAEHLITNEEFLELDELPRRMVLVGGGYIAAEFAHMVARAGVQVTVLQRQERMLPRFDPDLVDWLMESFQRAGIDVRTGHEVTSVKQAGAGFVVAARAAKEAASFETDLVVHAAGRVPDLEALNLGAARIEQDSRGHLRLNEFLQSTSNPNVYAAGDAAAKGPPLTPVSSHDGKVVAGNLLEGNRHRPDYRGVPSVAFSIPPIAAVGMSAEEARKAHPGCRIKSERASGWYTARRIAESVYGYKVIVDEETDRVLGAHLVGPDAEEVINLFGLAIRHGLTASDLKGTIFSYPTAASDIGYML